MNWGGRFACQPLLGDELAGLLKLSFDIAAQVGHDGALARAAPLPSIRLVGAGSVG
jgi:hypothetical protein